jgi:hypothetical protein
MGLTQIERIPARRDDDGLLCHEGSPMRTCFKIATTPSFFTTKFIEVAVALLTMRAQPTHCIHLHGLIRSNQCVHHIFKRHAAK